MPRPTPGQSAKPTPEPPPTPEVPTQTPKPQEAAQVRAGPELSLPQISTEDLRTEGLEPRFPPAMARVPVPAVPVTGIFWLILVYLFCVEITLEMNDVKFEIFCS